MTPLHLNTQQVLLALQQALLGEVPNTLRAVTAVVGHRCVSVDAYFHGPISDDDLESMSLVETELVADLPEEMEIVVNSVRLDHPALIPKEDGRIWVFLRKE